MTAWDAGGSSPGGRGLEDDVETLWRDPEARSRNRHFDRFTAPRDAHARRVVFFLLDLREILRRLPPGSVSIVREAEPRALGPERVQDCRGKVRLSYRDAVVGFSRVVFLTERELGLLVEDPTVAAHLGMTGEQAAP